MGARKDSAVSFLRLAANGHAREAYANYVAPGFRHHNPYFPADAQSLFAAMDDNARQNPDKTLDVQRALEDGDIVAIHSHLRMKPGDRGMSVVHIFRFEGERIVELWDLAMAVPAESPNVNGMF